MQIESLFAAAAIVVGLAQVVDALLLLRRQGLAQGWLLAFSAFEYGWAAICVLLLLLADLSSATSLLAWSFILYIPATVLVALVANPGVLVQSPQAVRVPIPSVWFGGVFGACYAMLGALYLLKV